MSRGVLLGTLLAIAAGPATGQQLMPRDFPLQDIESYTFQSATMGRRYEVVVALPPAYATRPEQRWPLLVVTDGVRSLLAAQDAAHSLAVQEEIEGLVIVSVGSPTEDGDSAFVRRRVHEFSPPDWPRADAFGQVVSQTCVRYGSAPDLCTGGAPQFLRFIVREVLPAIQAKYRVDPARLGLFGISAGGFFASWAIFQPESPFTTYIISSPAMAYGDGEIFRQEAKYAEGHRDLKTSIYLASGSMEIDHPMYEGVGQIVSGQARFVAALRGRNYPGLRLVTEIHNGLSHGDAAGTTLVRGIRLLYGTRP